ncbi:hypothetical protein GCK72_015357 [Caenorhabditis remanei]|uniref:Peptidase M13 C-terminal domain-containing protein n=1 Tax=Caenorhabditis remanei TaxID=31234 RepID=A0A6A5GUP8_CAERE|nr:hypothetical protein GCK72_015357 [Caenorhabditis remanei]KAF1758897.1 hypothetical protein GCK72_015357 [Caenorhabditis remanei]
MFEQHKMTEKDKKSNFSLKVFVILLVWIISVYAAVTFIRSSDEPPCKSESLPVKHRGVCKSPECITLAHQLHNWRDVSVDPCENFFKAACGKYNEHNLDPDDRFNTKNEIVARLIKEFLDKSLPSTSNSENAMHFLYQKCEESNKLNATEIADQEARSQLELIRRIGLAPILERNWNESDFDLNDMMARIGELGRNQFGLFLFVILNETLRLINERPDADQIGRDVKDVIKLNKELQEPNTNISGGIHLSTVQKYIPSLDFTRIVKSRIDPRRKEEVWERIQNKTVVLIDALYYSDRKKNVVMKKLPLAALRMFARNHFDKENLQIASDMVEDVSESFVETIQESSWLHETTKQRAIKKVKNMKKVIGYPKELEAPDTLDRFFESSMNHFAALFPFESEFHYLITNAMYHSTVNKLTLNVAFLDDPFFDSTYPKYAKVASIGEVIGHEIGHGYDPFGRQKDENGKENNWWTPEDSAEYDRRTRCLINQYNEYDDPDFGRNNWCSSRSETSLTKQLTLAHPTNSFRVNGVFSNMKSFAEAFNCPVGSPMNPEKKCQVF